MGTSTGVTIVAVVAHRKKTFGGGLDELRRRITGEEDVSTLLWYEVSKSRKAGKKARRAVEEGAELVFVWGGDGMVQRCVDALAGAKVDIAIVPAGTANLLAGNLGIPRDIEAAVRIGFHGECRPLDLGKLNGEHFAVMAGAGFDGAMIGDASRSLKERIGKLAYVGTALRHVGDRPARMRIAVDGTDWFDGTASCVLLGNVGTITGGIPAFDDAKPDDGWLEVGVSTAQGALQWARTLGRMVAGRSDESPFVRTTRAKTVDVRLGSPMPYELDGGARDTAKRLRASVVPSAITIRVPITLPLSGRRA
jgi:YegS/Rv2252/BmrU family lipid kinase